MIIVGGISFFWLLEGVLPLYRFSYHKWKHTIPNIFFTLTTVIINVILAFLLLSTAYWVKAHDFGLINWLPSMPLWLYVLLGVLFLDFFGAYSAHLIERKVKPLWMIHLVHHIESMIQFAFTLFGVFIVGAPIAVVMLYQSVSVVLSQFNHASIKTPIGLDKLLSYVIVSPDMYKIHHHNLLPYTDSNYGNIFSIWDRLLGTYTYLDHKKIVYGVDTFPDEKANSNLWKLLKQLFQKYRKPTNTV